MQAKICYHLFSMLTLPLKINKLQKKFKKGPNNIEGVVDLTLLMIGWRAGIVEVGCFNTAGFSDCRN